MKNIVLIYVCLCLTGCSWFVKLVNKPVWVCPAPPERSVLELKLDSLTSKSSTDEILKAMLSDVILLKGQNKLLINDLNVYRQPPEDMRLVE